MLQLYKKLERLFIIFTDNCYKTIIIFKITG